MGEDADTLETEDIEISDVPSEEVPITSPLLVVLGSHISPRSHAWHWTTTVGTIVLVVLVLLGSFPSLLTRAVELVKHPATLFNSNSSIVLTAHEQAPLFLYANPAPVLLGPAPQNCPATSVPQSFDAATFPPGIGSEGAPVWVTGFSGPRAQVAEADVGREHSQRYGWPYDLQLVVKADYPGPVFLFGKSLRDGVPLWFDNGVSIRGQDPIATFFSLAIDGERLPVKYDAQWRAWTVVMYVPTAGCYSLQAKWLGGSWQNNFAVGKWKLAE